MKKYKILLGIVLIMALVAPLFPVFNMVQAVTPQFTAARPTYLYGGGISSSATSIKLTSLKTPDGTVITTSQLVSGIGGVYYVTIEPATTRKETVSCTAVTQNGDGTALLTGCTRGLQFTYPYTASVALAYSHSGGSSVVLSNSPQLYNDIINYINGIAISGAPDASLTVKGIVQLATGLQQASSTVIGGGSTSAPLVLYTVNSTSTYNGATAPLKVVVTQNSGFIDQGFLATTTFTTAKTEFVSTSTGAGTFTVPTGTTRLIFELTGGGGGGGGPGSGNAGVGGGGGGGAGYCTGIIDSTNVSSLSYFIGSGGTAGGASAGGAGTQSFLINGATVYCGADGGSGGEQSGAAVGAGGTATTTVSTITIFKGQAGSQGLDAGVVGLSGKGGDSRLGSGAGSVGGGAAIATGLDGTGFGSGGSGGVASAASSVNGGAGKSGMIRIRW